MLSIKSRLLSAEDDFLSALGEGQVAISTFDRRWQTLLDDIDVAAGQTDVDSEVFSLAHTVSLRISMLADATAELYASCESFTAQLIHQVDEMMADLTISDPEPRTSSPVSSHDLRSTSPSMDSAQRTRKRRASAGDDSHPPTREMNKRRRFHSTLHPHPSRGAVSRNQMPFPEPVPAMHKSQQKQSTSHTQDIPIQAKRKRAVSDGDCSPNLPKRLCVGPRLHAVSDCFAPSLFSRKSETVFIVAHLGDTDGDSSGDTQRSPLFESLSPVDVVPLDTHDATLGLLTGIVEVENSQSQCTSLPLTYAEDGVSLSDLQGLDEFIQSLVTAVPGISAPTALDGPSCDLEAMLPSLDPPDYSHSPASTSSRAITPPLDHSPELPVYQIDTLFHPDAFYTDLVVAPRYTLDEDYQHNQYGSQLPSQSPCPLTPVVDWRTLLEPFDPAVWTPDPPPYRPYGPRSDLDGGFPIKALAPRELGLTNSA